MRMRNIGCAGIVLIIIAFALPALAADIAKIAVVDFQRVLLESAPGKAVQETIQTRGREMESDLRKKGEEIEQMTEQFNRDAMVMSRDKRDEKQREMEIRRYDFQTLQKKYQSEIRELENRMIEKLKVEIFEITEDLGQKEGYLLIIEQGAVVYSPAAIDITDKVIAAYNAKTQP
ncbi:MAG: OmpH family outer membrane protein [Desulfobacteraceae bacterium]|nr:MAG: OmpH family outer membrane protein [Desulfobacteraceae bacterium]